MTASPALKDRVLAYIRDCRARHAPADETTPEAIHHALGGTDGIAAVNAALQQLYDSGQITADNITPFCDVPTLSFKPPDA